MHKFYCKKTLSYFTLIELLVVIGIISILASLLLPALKNAMDTAKKITCTSNQKQIGLAFFQYAYDFRGYLLPVTATWWWTSFLHHEKQGLGTYLGYKDQPKDWNFMNQPVSFCPALSKLDRCRPGYVFSAEIVRWDVADASEIGLPLHKIKSPSNVELTLCGDGSHSSFSRYHIRSGLFGWNNHKNNSSNILYCDGRAASFVFVPDYSQAKLLHRYELNPIFITYQRHH